MKLLVRKVLYKLKGLCKRINCADKSKCFKYNYDNRNDEE